MFGIPGHDAVRQGKECSEEGQWIEKNGEKVWITEEEAAEINKLPEEVKFSDGYTTTNPTWNMDASPANKAAAISDIMNGRTLIKRGGERKKARHPFHLYRNGAKYREQKKFEKEYGKKKGDYIYGAIVGKVRRERLAKGRK